MPMFYVPKPRQFNYRPRFYDPQKERLEELRRKYAENPAGASQEDLDYFERRVREIDGEEKKGGKLTWKDLFRKRKMPTFEYKPRFADDTPASPEGATLDAAKPRSTEEHVEQFKESSTRIKRRLDYHKDFDREKFRVGVVIAVVVIGGFFIYRYHEVIIGGIYNFFF